MFEKFTKPTNLYQGKYTFYKKKPFHKVWWVDNYDIVGVHLFSFDREHVFNLFADYPDKLSEEQVKIFDRENPFWADFFSDRK